MKLESLPATEALFLSFAVIKSTGYYTRQSEAAAYYAAGQTASVWLRGHEQLGATAGDAVAAEDFDRICAGVAADGTSLVKARVDERMLGIDITCSAPKGQGGNWSG